MARGLARHVATALVMALATAALVILRIMERAELWNARTAALVAIMALGAFAGGLSVRLFLAGLAAPRGHRFLAPALFVPAFLSAASVAFVILTLVIDGHFEPHPDRYLRSVFWTSVQTAALFLYSCASYLLPWPLPALAALATFLLPTKPVEPAAKDV